MKKNNLLIKLLTLLIIIAAVLPVFYMPAYAVEEEYGTQDISDHGISEQGENITSSESETSYVEEGNNVFDIVPKGYTLKAVQTRSVEFIIQYPPGQPTGNVTYELKKEINNREIVVKRGTLNKSQKKITFKDLELNYICLFDYLFISSQMSAKPYFIGSTGIFSFVVNLTYLGLSSYIFAIKRG